MIRRIRQGIATAIMALVWTTNPGAAGVQQGGRDFSPHGQAEYGRGYEQSPGRRDKGSRRGADDDGRRERQGDYRRDERPHRGHDHRRYDDARKRPGGGVIMSQPHEQERPRRQPPGYGPYGPFGPHVPYGPYGPRGAYGPNAPYDSHDRRGR
jgi:hypothetical protein